jgi:hypothetical protein
MTIKAPRPTRYQKVSAEAKLMLQIGESGRYEFKQDAEAVSPRVLAALANWVALDHEREVAHVLVGVQEIEDVPTGLVTGRPCGLLKGLDRTVARIQDVASKTRPIPVDVFIIEEAVDTNQPFVRVEVRPTMPPHYDDEGRRQTRQGRSTRALTDEELLQIYLTREAGSFAARYHQVSAELHAAVGVVGIQVDSIADAIDRRIAKPIEDLTETAAYAASSASAAEQAADAVAFDIRNVENLVHDLQNVTESLLDRSVDALAAQVADKRRTVWWNFTVDTWRRTSPQAQRLDGAVRELLSSDISLDDARNIWEIRVWSELMENREGQRGGSGSLRWWDAAVKRVTEFLHAPSYEAPELPDLRAELRSDVDRAREDPDS